MESSHPKKVTVEISRKEMLDFRPFVESGVRQKCAEAGIPLDKYGTGTTEKGVLSWHDEPSGTRVIEWQPEEPAR